MITVVTILNETADSFIIHVLLFHLRRRLKTVSGELLFVCFCIMHGTEGSLKNYVNSLDCCLD